MPTAPRSPAPRHAPLPASPLALLVVSVLLALPRVYSQEPPEPPPPEGPPPQEIEQGREDNPGEELPVPVEITVIPDPTIGPPDVQPAPGEGVEGPVGGPPPEDFSTAPFPEPFLGGEEGNVPPEPGDMSLSGGDSPAASFQPPAPGIDDGVGPESRSDATRSETVVEDIPSAARPDEPAFDEWADEPPPTEPEPAVAEPTALTDASAATTASAPPLVGPRTYRSRPSRRTLRSAIPTTRELERVAQKTFQPALYAVGIVLLLSALALHFRQGGQRLEALVETQDVESLLEVLHGDNLALRERSRQLLSELLETSGSGKRVSQLEAALRCPDTDLQRKAAAALCRVETDEATRAIANAARDYTERLPDDVRAELVDSLAMRPGAEATEALLDGLQDRAATIREVSYAHLYARLRTLAERGAIAQLARIMDRGDADLSGAAITALGGLRDAAAVRPLAEFAADYANPPERRQAAVRALSALSGEQAREALRERLSDYYPAVREAAGQACPGQQFPAAAGLADALRERATDQLHAALAHHFEGRQRLSEDGEPLQWEDEARELGRQLHEAAGASLVRAVFHDLSRRLRSSHGRSPRRLRLLWQQHRLW